MNENTKKIGLIAIIVLAIVAAGFGAKTLFVGEQMQVENTVKMPAGYKSEKQRALEQQAQTGAQPIQGGKDSDLSGDLSGGGK